MAQTGYYDRDRTNPAPAGQMNHAYSHHGNVAEYQGSGFPFLFHPGAAPTDTRIEFPYVTQWIVVTSASAVYIAFKDSQSNEGGDACRLYIPADTMMPLRVKCVDMWVTSVGADVSVMAGLTNVLRGEFPLITGLEGVASYTTGSGTGAASTTTPA
jgi:hypothetical protein